MGMFNESCYNTRMDRYVVGLSKKDSSELTLLVGSLSKIYCIIDRYDKYSYYSHPLRLDNTMREPYNFMYFCTWHLELDKYDKVNIIIEQRELYGQGGKVMNRTIRLSEIEKDLINSGRRFSNAQQHIEWLQETYRMNENIAMNTYFAMCDWSRPSFNVIIEWTQTEEPKVEDVEKSIVRKVIDKIFKKQLDNEKKM